MKRKASFSRRESDSFAFTRFREQNYSDSRLDPTIITQPAIRRFDDAIYQESYIDADVLIEIFYSFPRRDLDKLKTVCKFWFNCANHPKLSWRILGSWTFDEVFSAYETSASAAELAKPQNMYNYYKRAPDGFVPLTQTKVTNSNKCEIVPKGKSQRYNYTPRRYKGGRRNYSYTDLFLFSIKGSNAVNEGYEIGRHTTVPYGQVVEDDESLGFLFDLLTNNPDQKDTKFKELFDIQVTEKVVEEPTGISVHQNYDYNTRMHETIGSLYLRKIHAKYDVTLHINILKLEQMFAGGLEKDIKLIESGKLFIGRQALLEFDRELVLPNAEDPYYPPSKFPIIEHPEGMKLKLWKYQLDAVSWMTSIEKQIDSGIKVKYMPVIPWNKLRSPIVFDRNMNPMLISDERIKKEIFSMDIQGGVLADQMGLGKTIELLGLIKAHPDETDEVKEFNYALLEDGTSTQLSKASIVICPNHLVKQWKDELEQHSEPSIKVVVITVIKEHKATSYQDIFDADVIIMSFQFLLNANYIFSNSGQKAKGTVDQDLIKRRSETFLPKARKTMCGKKFEKLKGEGGPLLEAFKFRRIILDEGHEVATDYTFLDSVKLLQSDYRWFVSGTPFPNDETVYGILDFLNVSSNDKELDPQFWKGLDQFDEYQRWLLADVMVNNLYWRNTKISIKEEYNVPTLIDDVIQLDFHPIESALYEDAKLRGEDQRQRQLCNNYQLSAKDKSLFGEDDRTLYQARKIMIKTLKSSISNLEDRIPRLENSIADARVKISNMRQELSKDVGTDEELSEDEEKALKEIQNREKARLNRLNKKFKKDKKSSSASEEDKDEFEEEMKKLEQGVEKEALKEEEKKAKKLKLAKRAKKRLLKKTKNYLRNSLASLESSIELLEIEKQSLANFEKIPHNNKFDTVPDTQQKEDKGTYSLPKAIKNLSIDDINAALEKRELSTSGTKADKIEKLTAIIAEEDVELRKSALKNFKDVVDENLIQVNGTKLAATVLYIKKLILGGANKDKSEKKEENENGEGEEEQQQDNQAKILVFSQFNSFLHKFGYLLGQSNISHVFIEGTVVTKQKAIDTFKYSETSPVMMLSLENAASGTNLIQATHVILLDPVQGTKKESKAIEGQAIGRAHRQGQTNRVTVARFLVNNTVELEQYREMDENIIEVDGEENNNNPNNQSEGGRKKRLLRSSSTITLAANSPSLTRSHSSLNNNNNNNDMEII